ncbi:MAG: hypothetical protein JWQ94_3733 [Tardiphaga sp.]|nr:hypothetical protein [Tardiphaga sp.]
MTTERMKLADAIAELLPKTAGDDQHALSLTTAQCEVVVAALRAPEADAGAVVWQLRDPLDAPSAIKVAHDALSPTAAGIAAPPAEPKAYIVHDDPELGDYLTRSRLAAESSDFGYTALYAAPPAPSADAVRERVEANPYEGFIKIDARLLHSLWCYGNLQTVEGVIYEFGSHQECLAAVAAIFQSRALSAPVAGADAGMRERAATEEEQIETARMAVRDEYGSRLCFDGDDMKMVRFCERGPRCRCREIGSAVVHSLSADATRS